MKNGDGCEKFPVLCSLYSKSLRYILAGVLVGITYVYAYCQGDIVVYKAVDYVVSSLSRLPFFLLTSLESSPAILTELSSGFQAW